VWDRYERCCTCCDWYDIGLERKKTKFIYVPCGKGEKDCNIWCKGGNDEERSKLSRSGEETMHMCGLNDEGMERGINGFPRPSRQESLRTVRI
jgi:hypothetical protein